MKYLKHDQPLLVMIGPSGAGKSLLVEKLLAENLVELTASWTTRPLRIGEEGACDHKFVSDQDFDEQEKAGFFLETAELFNTPYKYGLPKITHNNEHAIPTIMLRIMVLEPLYNYYNNVIVYQIETDKDLVLQRLQKREIDETIIRKRMENFQQEVESGRKVANRVFENNADFEELFISVKLALEKDFSSYLD